MKNFIQFLLLFTWCVAVQGQSRIILQLSPRLGQEVFALDKAVEHPGGKYQLKLNRFEYYLSDLRIIHDGGKETPVIDYYILARPALDSMYDLGTFPGIDIIEGIRFSVGVDPDKNHLDPATYVTGHPLAPQDPSMHWGWVAGYRFAAIEGVSGSGLNQVFEIHALGDENYKTLTIPTRSDDNQEGHKVIRLTADYNQVFSNLNLSRGLIVHGSTGAAVTTMNNFASLVFKSSFASAQDDWKFEGDFSINPNPVSGNVATVGLSLPQGHRYSVILEDLNGKTLLRKEISAGDHQILQLDLASPGMYLVKLTSDGKTLETRKIARIN